MQEKRITRANYDALIKKTLTTATPDETLNHLGTLIDAAEAFRDTTGAQHALTTASNIDTSTWTSPQRATLHFFLANANRTGTFRWSTNEVTPSITTTPTTTKTYRVRFTDDDGCSAAAEQIVNVRPLPTASISTSAVRFCHGDAGTITASLSGTPPWNVTWSDGATQQSDAATVQRSVTTDGKYTIAAIRDAHCTGIATGTATVEVTPAPTISISGPTKPAAEHQ